MPIRQRKIALMGFRSVGKSSVTIQYVENHFVDSYDPTIENTFQKNHKINGQDYVLDVVDTAGQDEYSILPQTYFMSVDGYILVYSVNSRKSFDVVKIIHDKLLDMKGNIKVPVILVGNKRDVAEQFPGEREVSEDEAKGLARKWEVPFMETSAKEHESVKEVFSKIILAIERLQGNEPEKSSCLLS
ncbi:GTP-binding protein Rheb homolog [Mizuhopecten yessoensis]|uniref:GTP-binding protein Rheb homolog n=1 Tax=Mizuhopecten yessoensis TaxID=6573 RepID=UPI000B45F1EA|nr:GTP-binding protein Rheb homolog [Mizuhopecten yessoensis]